MNVPFTALHFATYESAKKLLVLEEDESLAVQLAAGGTAGGVSAALTTPLDVVKTRLQLEGVNSATRYGTTAVVSLVVYITDSMLVAMAIVAVTGYGLVWPSSRHAMSVFHLHTYHPQSSTTAHH